MDKLMQKAMEKHKIVRYQQTFIDVMTTYKSLLEAENKPLQQHDVNGSADLEEGYYKINGTKRILYWTGEMWMKPVKDQQGRLGSWLGHLEKQPKVKTTEYIKDVDKHCR